MAGDARCPPGKARYDCEDVIDRAGQEAKKIAKADLAGDDLDKIALGGLVFAEFCQDFGHNSLFAWDRIFNTAGMSGPYIQYALVRLQAILNKAKVPKETVLSGYDWQAERTLLVRLSRFSTLMIQLEQSRQLHRLATYVYDCCRELNRYYENTPVLKSPEPVRRQRLWLLAAINRHLRASARLLGLEVPSRM